MKKSLATILLVAALTIAPGISSAQYNLDYGGILGTSAYLGEIGGSDQVGRKFISDMKISQTRYALGAFARYRVHPLISARANLMYIQIRGADSLTVYAPRNGRNLHFRNNMFELSLIGEYNFYSANDILSRGSARLDFQAFAFIGVAFLYHNPQAQDKTGEWVNLQPLGTEGQGWVDGKTPYSQLQITIPGGIGLHYTYKRAWRIGWELSVRKTFTDYLDDVSDTYIDASKFGATETGQKALEMSDRSASSQAVINKEMSKDAYGVEGALRGNSSGNDFYMHTAFTISKVIRGKSNFYRSKYSLITGSKKAKRKTRAKF